MNRLDVTTKIQVYEVDGSEVEPGKDVEIGVSSHWGLGDRVVLIIGKKQYTVIADDLHEAVKRAEQD